LFLGSERKGADSTIASRREKRWVLSQEKSLGRQKRKRREVFGSLIMPAGRPYFSEGLLAWESAERGRGGIFGGGVERKDMLHFPNKRIHM